MSLQVRLHLGAHKTATTHLQQTLLRNQDTLAEAGVHYIELYRLREILTRPFSALLRNSAGPPNPASVATLRTAVDDELRRAVRDRKRPVDTLALSDENIMGSLALSAKTGKLYGNRLTRLQMIKTLFQELPTTVAFTIRNYNDFYPSVYAQIIKQGWIISYADFLRNLDLENNRWVAIVADISRVFGRDRLRLFRYEDYPANLAQLLESIVGRKLSLEVDAAKTVYPSLNVQGIELLLRAGNILSRAERRRLGFYLASEFTFDHEYGKPSIEDPALRSRLDGMYLRDNAELEAYFSAKSFG